ncbi:MAG TPA: archaellin/type IV pilin N-terminal domain-containing protein [Candidatus Bathyarchaeia archaeon]|nr:archaellin/type IV pilin N-terminal domain-containing protein [Candidatus Bathyarchaeia archaeon]
MAKKLINKIFPRKKDNKRAVSPVIATILIIALTVTAGAVVYFVVVPLLQGNGELVLTSSISLKDTNADGSFDTIEFDLYNIGTEFITIKENVSIIIFSTISLAKSQPIHYESSPINIKAYSEYIWQFTSHREYNPQETKTAHIHTTNNLSQILPLSQYEFTISYNSKTLTTGKLYSSYTTETNEESEPEPPLVDYLSTELFLRTAQDDSSTSRVSFPTAAGYSHLLWFLVGIFESGVKNLEDNSIDYINSNGFGLAEDYRPYYGSQDTFSQSINAQTAYQILPYNDSGLYPGCITFNDDTFDPDDNLDWPQRGIVYMFSYIYNPTEEAMDIDVSIQADDAYSLWINGEFQGSGVSGRTSWKTWRTPVRVTLNPGYNIFTVRSTAEKSSWDAQILFWDAGDIDAITSLLNVWPFIEPTSSYW